MHLKRFATAIIAIPILIYIIGPYSQRWAFYSVLFFSTIIALKEFYDLTAAGLPKTVKGLSYLITLLLFLVIYNRQFVFIQLVMILFAAVPLTFYLFARTSTGMKSTADIGKAVLGPVYIVIPSSMILQIDRYYPDRGYLWIFFLLAVIFANDTGAFYCGSLLGRHKLYKAISPKKTWEGAIGGLICSLLAAVCFIQILRPHPLSMGMVLLALGLSVAGQIGDLVESMLKRNHEIKDSGSILPGHGGMLDRIDSLLFAIPVLFTYLNFTVA